MRLIRKADEVLEKILKGLSLCLMGIMVLLVFLEVIFRYFIKIPCAWTEELARLALVWCVFLASAVAVRHAEHPNIEVFIQKLPRVLNQLFLLLGYVMILVFGGVLVYYGSRFAYSTRLDHMTSLGYPRNLFYWPAVIGGALYSIYSAGHIIRLAAGMRKGEV